jgi:ribosomal protein L20A (L18A)
VDIERDSLDSEYNEQYMPSFLKRVVYTFKGKFLSRALFAYEMEARSNRPPNIIEVRFFAPRMPIYFDILIPATIRAHVASVKYIFEDQTEKENNEFTYAEFSGKTRIRFYPPSIRTIEKIEVRFKDLPDRFNYEVQVFVKRVNYYDLSLFVDAIRLFDAGRYDGALEECLEYDEICARNPYSKFLISQIYQRQQKTELGKEYALKTIAQGLDVEGLDKYREMAMVRPFSEMDELKSLRENSLKWEIPSHYGAVVLSKSQNYFLGFDGLYLKRHKEIIQIRRPVAARMLTSLDFNFSNRELLLCTFCRIIPKDGQVKELELERFVVGDSKGRNIYIVTEEEKSGTWILPDLAVGDIIEYNYDLLCHEGNRIQKDKAHLFIISPLAHEFHPTCHCSISIHFPPDYDIIFDISNKPDNLEQIKSNENGKKTLKFALNRYIPERNTDFHQENYFRNPVLACATSGYTWPEIAKFVMSYNLGDPELNDELPDPLSQMLEGDADPIRKLRDAFYWTRDKLKYAAIGSAIKHIGKIGRARAIIDSGVADCKDKAYLLNQFCKRLGLTSEFIAVSTKFKIIFENLPCDQFDHVFVRVKSGDDWLYLDASNRLSVFGSRPNSFQSSKMLVLNSDQPIEIMPEESPGKNKLTITETLDQIDLGWLSGTFHIRAEGNIARIIDENWKWRSINVVDQLRSSQAILKGFMPEMLLVSCDRICNTSLTDIFEAVGTHRRCQLGEFTNRCIGVFDWRIPTLPVDYWRNLTVDKFYVFYEPTQLEINLIFIGDLSRQIEEFSGPNDFDNDICKISSYIVREKERLLISKKYIIKKKFVEQDNIREFNDAMEQLEKALQFAVIFNAADEL